MKKLLLASVATLATVSALSAFAADLPARKAPVIAPPPPLWTGFYAGLNAGYNFGTNGNAYSQTLAGQWVKAREFIHTPDATGPIAMSAAASNAQSGFIGGGQIGYNYQYGSNFVLGVEADIQGAGVRGSSYGVGAATGGGSTFDADELPNTTAVGQTGIQGGVDWLGTVRGRIGYLWTPTLLIYGTGGLAYGNVYANVTQSAVENVTETATHIFDVTRTVYRQTNGRRSSEPASDRLDRRRRRRMAVHAELVGEGGGPLLGPRPHECPDQRFRRLGSC